MLRRRRGLAAVPRSEEDEEEEEEEEEEDHVELVQQTSMYTPGRGTAFFYLAFFSLH